MVRFPRGFSALFALGLLIFLLLVAWNQVFARTAPPQSHSMPAQAPVLTPTVTAPSATPIPTYAGPAEAERLPASERRALAIALQPPSPTPEPPPTPDPGLPPAPWIPGDGPWMRGERVAQTERIDFYVGRGTLSPEQVAHFAPAIEWALSVTEQRFGERLRQRVSLGFYRGTRRDLRGMAYTDEGRAELYYLPNESTERLVAVAVHELAHHLQAQRYGVNFQKRSDTILLEGAATWISGDHWLPTTGASNWRERARQLRDTGVPLRLLGAERYGANNAYELWASFVDFLLERYGFPRYKALYASGRGRAHGSADYEGVLGKPLSEVSDEWRAWVGE